MELRSNLIEEIRRIEGGKEIDKCFQCGTCTSQCRVAELLPDFNPRALHNHARIGLEDELLHIFKCTLCGRCKVLCPRGVETRELRIAIRQHMVSRGKYPENLNLMKDAMEGEHNVANFPNVERAMWAEFLEDAPPDLYVREKASILYFVGCMASFSPAIQSIPSTFVTLLDRVGLDFTIMGEDEWCCGYPLLVAGMGHYIHPLKEHNLKKVEEIGAKRIIFTCPSCYHTWKNEYRVEIDVLHHTEFMLELIDEGKIKLRQIPCKVTYHDPCDLGRNSLIYQAPREVITSIPGVEFVEMRWSKEYALCCGGGGDLEVVDAKIPTEIGRKVIEQAKETGAEILVTSCQQCKRTLNSARGDGIEVVDVAELVMKAMG